MRTRSRRVAGPVGLLLALGLLCGLVAGCGDDEPTTSGTDGDPPAGVEGGAEGGGEGGGDVPGSPVLPDRLSVSADGSQVLADCWEGICRWDTADGSLAEVDDGSHLAITPDWSLVAGADDATVVLAEPGGEAVAELTGLDGEVQAVAFSPDGQLVAGAGPGGQVLVWPVGGGDDPVAIDAGAEVFALAFSPDGSRLATAGGGPIEVFDVPSGESAGTLPRSSGEGEALAWSPDGRWLAGPGPGGAPAVWDAAELALQAVLDGRFVEQAAFSPDSTTLALTDTQDDTVRLWEPAARGDRARELAGHTDDPVAVAFSPDGHTLYSASGRDGVLAWDVATASVDQELELPE